MCDDKSLENQKEATNPNYSVWVSASAGTGKTTVLVSRLLRLFLSGVDPTKVLCITYTNAGAIEMQNRIFTSARNWALMKNDEDLEKEIKSLFTTDVENYPFDSKEMENLKSTARKLFSKLIDNPIPLKIYTIHAFCQSVLKRFPIEAKISPHFKVIEDIDTQKLLKNAYKEFLISIHSTKDEKAINLLTQFELLTNNITQTNFVGLINEVIEKREKFSNLLSEYKTLENIKNKLKQKVFANFDINNIDSDITEEKYMEDMLLNLPRPLLKEYLAVLESASAVTMQKNFMALSSFLSLTNISDMMDNFNSYKEIFLTQENKIKAGFLSKELRTKNPKLYDDLCKYVDTLKTSLEFINVLKIYNLTVAVITIAIEVINIYKSLKLKENVMDFSDLIETVRYLFNQPNISEWILYKMDGGISHILIDEAQDTSPIQWEIVDTLTEEFFTSGRNEKNIKSIFSVGDRKQSIFGFQGADISLFEKYKKLFKNRVEKGNFIFKDLPLNRSFRSCKNILNLVDEILNNSDIVKGVLLPGEQITHIHHREDFDGYIELLPLVKAQKDKSNSFLKPPVEVVNVSNAKIELADIIAQKIKHILQNDFISITDKNTNITYKRKVEPRDIMILAQKRDNTKYLIQKLNEYHIPTAGQDKLNLSENIVVEDLLSLVKFCLSPYDDLSLAEVLKSPIFNLTDDDLFQLCYQRKSSLYNQLSLSVEYKNIYDELQELIDISRVKSPFLFFDYVLKVKNKRKNFIARFGESINDVLNEFIGRTLHYDKEKMGKSLFDFYNWFAKSKIEVKRDMEQVNNCIRIMTAHGSKGLEAPIVFLFDANINAANLKDKILWDENNLPIFKVSDFQKISSDFGKIYSNKKSSDKEEFYRLLYVALTRARDKLYISGWEDDNGKHTESWYSSIKNILEPIAQKQTDAILLSKSEEIVDNEILFVGIKNPTIEKELSSEIKTHIKNEIPNYFYTSLENNDTQFKSELSSSPLIFNIEEENLSLTKGRIIHKLLENSNLQDIENFKAKATEFLLNENVENIDKIISQIENILLNPSFSFMFNENSFSEIEVADENKTYRIDKLVITDNEIFIIDYKTDAVPEVNNIPSSYKKQLTNYKNIIKKIYPNHTIKTFILWFENTTLTEVIL